MDLKELDDQELDDLRRAVLVEVERRQKVEAGPYRVEAAIRDYQSATGRQDGGAWVRPQGAHDAYLEGAVVEHDGKTWVSLTPANVWEPGTSGWREATDNDDDSGAPDWVEPSGIHDAYQTGDVVAFEGAEYRSVIDGNVWSPTAYPQGWEKLDD